MLHQYFASVFRANRSRRTVGWLVSAGLLLSLPATAQLTITGLSPTRNLRHAAAGSNLSYTFDTPLSSAASTLGSVKVFSAQRGGRMQDGARGTATVSGSTLTFDPTTDFKPGETVFSTVTTAAQGTDGRTLPAGRVQQFTVGVANTGVGNFNNGTDPTVGTGPYSVAAGDVDGDGDLDLVTANVNANTASVRLNNGSGSFSGTAAVSVGGIPTSIVLGDVDSDGDLDMLVANRSNNTVSIRLNGGNATGSNTGTFSNGTDLAVGSLPNSVAVGDVDGDGDLDLLTANISANTVSVRLNTGSGSFSGTTEVPVGTQPYSVTVGDVDGDGDLDLLTANRSSGTVSVRLNGGDATGSNTGTFSNGTDLTVGSWPQQVVVGDVDGDGDLDLLTVNNGNNTVSVRLNGGDATGSSTGTFSNGSTVPVGNAASSLALGDVDGDGDLDLLAASAVASGKVNVRLNGGDATGSNTGTFSNGADATVGSEPQSIALGDVDGDGDLDLLAANYTASTVSVRLNQPVAAPVISSFTPGYGLLGASVTITGDNLTGATAARINGTAGTITANTATSLTFTVAAGSSSGRVSVTTPYGTATSATNFDVTILLTAVSPARNQRAAPANSTLAFTFDNPLSSGAATLGAVKVYSAQRGGLRRHGAGGTATVSGSTLTFAPTADFKPGETVFSTVTRAAQSSNGTPLANARVQQFTVAVGGTGRGNFTAPGPDITMGSGARSVVVGDVDGDGDLDLLTANPTSLNGGSVSVRLNGGDATGSNTGIFSNGSTVSITSGGPEVMALGDVDGDGDLDFVALTASQLIVRLNGGDATGSNTGIFSNGYNQGSNASRFGVALGDVDGDGDLDLAMTQNSGYSVSIFRNGGDATGSNTGNFSGAFSTVEVGSFPTSAPTSVALGDVDGDGDLDLLTANSLSNGSVAVRLNGGDATGSNTGTFSNGSTVAVGTYPTSVVTADVDGDGDLDLLTANSTANTVSVRLNGGDATGSNTGTFSNGSTLSVGSRPTTVAVGDVDGDGDLDLFTANNLASSVSVRLNGGDATGSNTGIFSNGSDSGVGTGPASVALGDLDGDGDLDFATANNTAGTASVRLNQPPAPTLTSFSPTSGPVGTSVTITGTNLTGATAVTVNGTAGTITANTATALTFTVGAGSTTGTISLTTAGGTATSAGNFTVITGPAPTVKSFSPTSAAVGATVTITGTNFTGATGVAFNGGMATSFTVVSATSITAVVPADASTGKISVTTGGGTAQSVGTFKVLPTISSFTPVSGAPGASVTITGAGLLGATAVKFFTVPATSFTVVNSTTITATVPATALTGKLYVTTPGGTATSAGTFTVAPIITGFLPAQGAPGSVVLVQGLNFTSTTKAYFNGLLATTTYNSTTQLTAVVPAAVTTGPVSATNTTGTGTSAATYTVVSGAYPTITSFTPNANVIAGTSITLTGTNFTGATLVRFNNVNAASYTINSATSITATVPAGATTGKLYVANPSGMGQSATSLTIIQPPTITTLAPTSGAVGSVVLLGGTNLTGATSVTLNGAAVPYTINSSAQIVVTIPAGATSGKFSATTIAGTALSAATFTVSAGTAPTITSLSPVSGLRGSTVVVTGTDFTGVTSVKLGAIAVTAGTGYTVNSATQITLTVPSTATTGRIYVTTSGGGMAQSPANYTVILAPIISSFSPASGAAGTLVTINGTNFVDISGVAFGGVAATSYTVVSTAKITATVPSGAVTGVITVTNPAGTGSKGTFTYTGARPGPRTALAEEMVPVELYPNPAHDVVRISGQPGATVTLRDGMGRIVRTALLTDSPTVLEVHSLPAGIYTVSVGTTTQRLVVE